MCMYLCTSLCVYVTSMLKTVSYLPAWGGKNYSLHTHSPSLTLPLSLRPPESYSCHSVTSPIHNWGVCTAQSPWNHVNHFQLLLLNNQAEPTVPGGNLPAQLPVSLPCVISPQLNPFSILFYLRQCCGWHVSLETSKVYIIIDGDNQVDVSQYSVKYLKTKG